MLIYAIFFLAAALFFANPISRFFSWPQPTQEGSHWAPPPTLNRSLLAIDGPDDAVPECPPDTFAARILRTEPLVVYLEGFLSLEERDHLLEIR